LVGTLKNVCEDPEADRQVRDHLYRAVLGFFANLIAFEGIRGFLKDHNQGEFMKTVLPSVFLEIGERCKEDEQKGVRNYADLMHRSIFIADEFLREEDFDCFSRSLENKETKLMMS